MFNEEKDKIWNSGHLLHLKSQKKTCRMEGGDAVGWRLVFRVRESDFSLGFRPIEPSVFDGARRKVALRGEDYAWAPIWWSSDNSKR